MKGDSEGFVDRPAVTRSGMGILREMRGHEPGARRPGNEPVGRIMGKAASREGEKWDVLHQ